MDDLIKKITEYKGDVISFLKNSDRYIDFIMSSAKLVWQGIELRYRSDANKLIKDIIAAGTGRNIDDLNSVLSNFRLAAELRAPQLISSGAVIQTNALVGDFYAGTVENEREGATVEIPDDSDWELLFWCIVGILVVALYFFRNEVSEVASKLASFLGLSELFDWCRQRVDKLFSSSDHPRGQIVPKGEFEAYREAEVVSQALSLSLDQFLLLIKSIRRIDVSKVIEERKLIERAQKAKVIEKQQAISILHSICSQ